VGAFNVWQVTIVNKFAKSNAALFTIVNKLYVLF